MFNKKQNIDDKVKYSKIFKEIYKLNLEIHKIELITDFEIISDIIIDKINLINNDIFEFNHHILIDTLFLKLYNYLNINKFPKNFKKIFNFLELNCKILPIYEKELIKLFKKLNINYNINIFENIKNKPLPTNLILKKYENNIEKNILSMRYKIDRGVSILDLEGNILWMDKYTENLFEKKISNNIINPLNLLNLMTNQSKLDILNYQTYIIEFNNNNESIIKYSIFSKKLIKKNIKNNLKKEINYSNYFKKLSSKIYILKMEEGEINKNMKKSIKNNIKKYIKNNYFIYMITRNTKHVIEKIINEDDINEWDLKIINNIVKGIKI